MAESWSDRGLVLALGRHGEHDAILEVLTERHGRHAGLVRAGASRRKAPLMQPGSVVALEWRARLETHLGSFRVEPVAAAPAALLQDRVGLAGFAAVAALCRVALPERQPVPDFGPATRALVAGIGGAEWGAAYARWELALLAELGFGLDLSACAVTGVREGLVHVSPRTGRAVSAAGAGDWAARLLPLPGFLTGAGTADRAALADAFRLSGHFLSRHLAPELPGGRLPAARDRAVAAILRAATRTAG